MPMRGHELVLVFYKKQPTYNPQGIVELQKPKHNKGRASKIDEVFRTESLMTDYVQTHTGYPDTILKFDCVKKAIHPTEKPVSLFETLIKTYTNQGDLVLDSCAGAGTTGIAAKNTGRNFILIEKEETYIKLIQDKLHST